MSSVEVVRFIGDRLEKKYADPGDISAELIRKCLVKNSRSK